MPGLLRGVVRTAAVAGTATAVSNRVSMRQAARWQQQGPQEPMAREPAPPSVGQATAVDQLKELAELKSQGILTEEEFASQKAKILGA